MSIFFIQGYNALMKSALTIAGADPTGGAGLQADLKVFRAFGVHGLSVATALTAQNTTGVNSILPVDDIFFERQMDALLKDIRPEALKTGMLYSKRAVHVIDGKIKKYALKKLVIDPVTVSSSGMSLAEDGMLDAMKERLFPLAKVVTPNIYEAAVLTGMNIEDIADMEKAAVRLKEMGPEFVIITGGHLEKSAIDLYYDGSGFCMIESEKIAGEYHGTGCAFSAAVTALLANGYEPLESAKKAKEYVTSAIRNAYYLGKGMGLLNL
ncbi:MAG: bifunctional hydroxymethylpyrimidine kinase/phosphomethylpyrimidine kinase [Nitrospirae bacterium]|nr:bifunctional hydroxymethylpyrimidine kinase/phosphomethylpyrimidine kinase [Nitrospirota bacterium]